MGFGHITRSLTLARALTDLGAEVVCIGQGMSQGKNVAPSFQKLDTRELSLAKRSATASEVLELRPDAVIADGYHFGAEFFDVLERNHIPYGVIDDNGETQAKNPRVVHNQNPSAKRSLYQGIIGEPEFLLGLENVLLRQEVGDVALSNPTKSGDILIGFGGTDVMNLTIPVSEALLASGFGIAVSETFEGQFRRRLTVQDSQFSRFFPQTGFLEALASSQFAVLGAGTSLWEANAVGTSALGVAVAENQIAPATVAKELGYLTDLLVLDKDTTAKEASLAIGRLVEGIASEKHKDAPNTVPLDSAQRAARVFLKRFSAE